MDLGFFAINHEREATLLNEEVLKYTRNDTPKVRWYGKRNVENGDMVLYFGRHASECIGENRLEQRLMCGGAWSIILFRYENKDCLPLVKQFELSENECKAEMLVDVVFSEEHVCVEITERETVRISIHRQSYERKLDEIGEGLLLLIRRGSIRFFSKPHNTSAEIGEILQGKTFAGYIEGEMSAKAEEFFAEGILNAAEKLTGSEDSVAFCNINGRAAAVSMLSADAARLGGYCAIYTIGDEKEYLDFIREKTQVYDYLFHNDEIKIGKNELSCEARLRGDGENIAEINRNLEKVCRKNVTIVITGESGTGKTFLAKEIHKNSRRSEGPFINVNCAAIAYNLIESELFGYEDGAFTGAKKGGKVGYFELAKGGTLFLDEISELPLLLQGKLLEVLQEGTFYRVGGVKKIVTDVRLIVATNRNLERMVKEGQFREDLYYRISVFPIKLPPLRERIEDLYSIIEDTLPSICERLEIEPLMLTDEALQKMKQYQWPGNIRELENVLEKAAVISEGNFIRAEDVVLDNNVAGNQISRTLKEKMRSYEKELIQAAFVQFAGNRKAVAEHLGISKTNLFEKVHQYGIDENPEEKKI